MAIEVLGPTTAAEEIIIRPASACLTAATTRRIRLEDPIPMGDTPAVDTIRRRTLEETTMDHRITEVADTRAEESRAATTRGVTVTTVAAMAIPEETITRTDADINRVTPKL